MRQDKDRAGKWVIQHHGNALLKLAGLGGFTSWRATQPETVAPRRIPDGVLEVQYPGEPRSRLAVIEIETFSNHDADRQMFEDLMLLAVEQEILAEGVMLVLRPRGRVDVAGEAQRVSPSGQTQLRGRWRVVRLWELQAADLLAEGDVGLVPWVPLTQTDQPPEVLLETCRDRLWAVENATERAGLLGVAQILANLAYPDRRFLNWFGGPQVMIESPVLDEVKEILRKQYFGEGRAEGLAEGRLRKAREAITRAIGKRFGPLTAEQSAALETIADEQRLDDLLDLAVSCPDLATFTAALG